MASFQAAISSISASVELGVLAQRQADVLRHRQRAEQAAMLEHHAPALAQRERFVVAELVQVDAEHPDRARVRALQQDHFAQQRRLAGAAAADQREDLGAAHLEVESGVHDVVAEARRHLADLDDRCRRSAACVCACQRSSALKATENSASATITRKIDCTTLRVVWRPTLSAPPLVRKP